MSKYQFRTLTKLANSQTKVYCSPAGTPRDKHENEINEDFNGMLRLVELGLMVDVSDAPKYEHLIHQYAHEEGRDVVVTAISKMGDLMFKRTRWEKWLN